MSLRLSPARAVLAAGLALSLGLPQRALAAPVSSEGVRVVIETDTMGKEAKHYEASIIEQVRDALEAKGLTADPSGAAQLDVVVKFADASTRAFKITVTATRPGAEPTAAEPVTCEYCVKADVLAKVSTETERAIAELQAPEPDPASEPEPTPSPDPDPADDPTPPQTDAPKPKRIGPVGYTGIALGVAGLAGVITGAVFATQPIEYQGSAGSLEQRDPHTPGYIALGVGAGLLVAGVVMISVDVARRKKRRLSFAPLPTGLLVKGTF